MTVEDPFAHLHEEGYASAYDRPLIGADSLVDPGGRPMDALTDWGLTLDPFEEGLRQRWFALDDRPMAEWTTPRDFDDAGATPARAPCCWTMLDPEWRRHEGAVWHVTHFDHARGPHRTVLRFGAANYAALVFLNGRFLGRHLGGSTPFCVELTEALHEGRNRLMVMVENHRRSDRVPMGHIDWFNHGGLHREVALLRLPPVFIRAAGFALTADGVGIAVDVTLSDPVDGVARVAIPALGIHADLSVAAGAGRVEIAAAPDRWSPETPRLHDVAVSFGDDVFRERVGFRTLAVEGERILLNGRPIWLRGVCVHEDDRDVGRVSTEADVRRRFGHARALGCNFLRLAHYPHHEHVARIADEEGFLLWSEIPVYWAIDFANPATFADAENQLRELIARDRNRASVALWGVGNENADTDARLSFMSRLAAAARAADPTRLIAAACLIDRVRFAIADRLAETLDVIGLNEYFGWYEPGFEGLERLLANSEPGKPVIVSETGADGAPGLRGTGLFTEHRQAEIVRRQIETLRRFDYVQGVAWWLLYDFRSDRRQTGVQRGFNRKGLVADDKATLKAGFHALAEAYAAIAGRKAD
ncbi:glycoside hydrolase family 2 protein [Rubrimonas sp.]|uniref:glycoside hydrolase family 2 protein n=1 Tax=Rubrimonas sp. TaxID=2036015 RepID=UPI002FDDE4DC